jgi:hypothetical protein
VHRYVNQNPVLSVFLRRWGASARLRNCLLKTFSESAELPADFPCGYYGRWGLRRFLRRWNHDAMRKSWPGFGNGCMVEFYMLLKNSGRSDLAHVWLVGGAL